MAAEFLLLLRRACRRGGKCLWQSVSNWRKCRACGQPAGLLVKFCGTCGALYPVRLDISPAVWITALGAEAAILFLRMI